MTTQQARGLRKNLTPAERKLWQHIRLRQLSGHKFRRQQPIEPYIVDSVCLEKRLAIEVDGGHHSGEAQEANDRERLAWLESQGFRVIRFWNNEIINNIEGVVAIIMNALEETTPSLALPRKGGED